MEGPEKKKKDNKITERKTFPVSFALTEGKANISISTNTHLNLSKKQIIDKAVNLHSQGKIQEAGQYYQYFINKGFKDHTVFSNYGMILKEFGKLENAELLLYKAIEINPNFAEAHSNLGIILRGLNKLEQAEISLRTAIKINPDFANAHYNLGNLLIKLGKLEQAEISLRTAIKINPDFANAHYNLGNLLTKLGKLEDAEISQLKAIEINPNFAEAHSNLGNILNDLGKLKEAEISLLKAIELNPNSVDAVWNLYGLANNIKEAEARINQCLKIDKNFLNAYLTLSALKLHQGDRSLFDNLIKSNHKDHSWMRSFKWVTTLPKLPQLFFNRWLLFDNMIKKSKKNRPFYEFGVWRGVSFQYLINTFKKGYGFDTFKGLPKDWHDEKQGKYSADGIIPKIDGGEFIAGKFEDTLPKFFTKPRPIASIINFDADLYSSTLCALNYSKSVIDSDTILIFDEFFMNKRWEKDEYKALNQYCSSNNLSYEVLAISYFTKQVAIKIIGL